VHCVGTDYPLFGIGKVGREHDRGTVLPAAETAMAADEALERRDLLGTWVDQAVDVDVRAFGAARGAPSGCIEMQGVWSARGGRARQHCLARA